MNNETRTFSYSVDYVFLPKIVNMRFAVDRDDASHRTFLGQVDDFYGIKSITLHSLRIGQLVKLQFTKGVYNYELNEDFWYPPTENFGEYPLTLQITNHRDLVIIITDFEDILGD